MALILDSGKKGFQKKLLLPFQEAAKSDDNDDEEGNNEEQDGAEASERKRMTMPMAIRNAPSCRSTLCILHTQKPRWLPENKIERSLFPETAGKLLRCFQQEVVAAKPPTEALPRLKCWWAHPGHQCAGLDQSVALALEGKARGAWQKISDSGRWEGPALWRSQDWQPHGHW